MNKQRILTLLGTASLIVCFAWAASGDAPKPQYGTFGLDTAGGDPATKPGDDFFRYANGTWIDHVQIPADKPAYSLRLAMTDLTEQRIHDIMDEDAAKAAHAPADTAARWEHSTKPSSTKTASRTGCFAIASQLAAVRDAKTPEAIAALMGRNNSDFDGTLFGYGIDVDEKDPTNMRSISDRPASVCLTATIISNRISRHRKPKYEAYVAQLLHLLNWPDADARAKDIVAFETAVAQVSWTKAQDRDPIATYNPMALSELETLAPTFPWKPFLASAGLGSETRVVVAEKSAFPKIAAIFSTTSRMSCAHGSLSRSPTMRRRICQSRLQIPISTCATRHCPASRRQAVRWKRAVHAVSGGDYGAGDRTDRFGKYGLGGRPALYRALFHARSESEDRSACRQSQAAYRARLEKLDWMDATTKAEALKKLDTYNIKSAIPIIRATIRTL